ncbi:unnamed protein product [Scytosiphon promiscuus]
MPSFIFFRACVKDDEILRWKSACSEPAATAFRVCFSRTSSQPRTQLPDLVVSPLARHICCTLRSRTLVNRTSSVTSSDGAKGKRGNLSKPWVENRAYSRWILRTPPCGKASDPYPATNLVTGVIVFALTVRGCSCLTVLITSDFTASANVRSTVTTECSVLFCSTGG